MKSIKRSLGIVILCLLTFSNVQAQEAVKKYQTLKLDFDEARVYLYDGSIGYHIVEKRKLDSTIIDKKGYKLSKTELFQLDSLLSDTSGMIAEKIDTLYKNTDYLRNEHIYEKCDEYFCFMPHHGIVFYKNHKIVGEVSICFRCNHIHSDFLKSYHVCTQNLIPLFNSFRLKVNNTFYQPNDDELASAIVQLNINRYGKDYVQKRRNWQPPYIKRKK
jgi:hypothetical protein